MDMMRAGFLSIALTTISVTTVTVAVSEEALTRLSSHRGRESSPIRKHAARNVTRFGHIWTHFVKWGR